MLPPPVSLHPLPPPRPPVTEASAHPPHHQEEMKKSQEMLEVEKEQIHVISQCYSEVQF